MRNRAGLGLLALLIFGCVFSIEAILSVMRVRKLSVTVDVQNAQGVVLNATAEATKAVVTAKPPSPQGTNAQGTTALEPLNLPSAGTLVVNANWDYRIGPTFPQTLFRAQVVDANLQVVAASEYKINCGTDSLDCRGTSPMPLNYGVVNGSGTRANWPVG